MATIQHKGTVTILKSTFVILLFIFIGKFILRQYGIEGFSWNDMLKQLQDAQNKMKSYGDWVGYAYRTSNTTATAEVLNDFKRRVFNDECEFREWKNPPIGMSAPNGAANGTLATLAYKTYIQCLDSGNGNCYSQLQDARTRFMKPGCQFKNPIDTKRAISSAFK